MNTVAIIPARSGSKGIPGKNLMDFCGKPLLAWSILQARHSKSVRSVWVSSDGDEILGVAESFGAKGIKRPDSLSTDTAPSEAALLNALDYIEGEGEKVDLVVFLQATSPLREPDDIDRAVERLLAEGADSLFSMAVLHDFCVWSLEHGEPRGLTFDPLDRGRRQDRKPLYLENGSIYVFRPGVLRKKNNRLGGSIAMFEMPYWQSFEIDTPGDVELCAWYFEKRLLHHWQGTENAGWARPSDIDLLVYDFDGVMTDNRVIVSEDGREAVTANRSDGLGVGGFRSLGIPQLIITTEANPVVKRRADKLGLEVISSCEDKREALIRYCEKKGFSLARVVFVGNDVNDLEVMKVVGYPAAPGDAHPRVRAVAKLVTEARGGCGVIKELFERTVKS